MNKNSFSFFFIIIALLVGAFYYNNTLQSPLISLLNSMKIAYNDSTLFIQKTLYKHTFQATHIEELENQLQKYEKNHLVMQQLANEVNDLYQTNRSKLTSNSNIELVRAISYEKFGNFNKVWMEIPEYNSSKIYGLTYKELVAGIVISKDEKPLALLNRDIKCAYSVYVGSDNAPGIAHGNNDNLLIINFIPAWFNIQKGDEVISSGLDNIFIKGLKVGKVLSVKSAQGYQNAIVEPYYKAKDPTYFHMIRSIR